MELRLRKCVSLIALCTGLLPLLQAHHSASHQQVPALAQMIYYVENNIPSEYKLPGDFSIEVWKFLPNETLDTLRPFSKQRTSAKFTPSTESIGHESHFQMALYQCLIGKYRVPRDIALDLLAGNRSPFCKGQPTNCDSTSPYRTIDGSCNNLQNPFWGASFRAFERVLPAAYEDDFMEPRGGIAQKSLPNPRRITTTIHYDLINPDPSITNMVPQIGQFVDHDLSLSPEADRHCCTSEEGAQDCWSIKIPLDDPFYSTLRQPQTCMPFTRSTPYCFPGPTGMREQFNILTSFLDASQVYGSDAERAEELRAFEGGRLAVHSRNPNVLPTVAEIESRHNKRIAFMGKYLAGDERVNEMPALTTLHILLVREHNRIASEIEKIRPNWADKQIFEEARRLLIAQWQNVIYGEYLPVILGKATMTRYNLHLDDGYSVYHPSVNPTIFHAFATAAYRFGHTLINGIIQLYRGLHNIGSYELKENFFESEQVDNDNWDGYNLILGGLMIQNAQTYDSHITVALSNFVLKERQSEFGADLIARNVQRGREHGIPSYSEYRKLCKLRPLTTWFRKPDEILQDTWDRLQFLYRNPSEIDLFTGGISEIPVPGAFSGPTFNCLKALQFRRVRYGDRFFFTHGNQAGSFSPEQLKNIRSRTLGDIICENSNVEMTTIHVFRTPSVSNPQLFCEDPTRNFLDFDLLLQNKP